MTTTPPWNHSDRDQPQTTSEPVGPFHVAQLTPMRDQHPTVQLRLRGLGARRLGEETQRPGPQ